MTRARERTAPPNCSVCYHCVSRRIRLAWLCYIDFFTGKDYEHRRERVENRLLMSAEVYSVSIYVYAVMSNHWHALLTTYASPAPEWSYEEVSSRWCWAFPGSCDPESQNRLGAQQISELPE